MTLGMWLLAGLLAYSAFGGLVVWIFRGESRGGRR